MLNHALAEAIVDRLMTNGANQKAERLVLELPGNRDGGGLSRKSAVLAVYDVLRQSKDLADAILEGE